jgi:hypothetical protein
MAAPATGPKTGIQAYCQSLVPFMGIGYWFINFDVKLQFNNE